MACFVSYAALIVCNACCCCASKSCIHIALNYDIFRQIHIEKCVTGRPLRYKLDGRIVLFFSFIKDNTNCKIKDFLTLNTFVISK